MFPRYLVAICVLAFVVVINAQEAKPNAGEPIRAEPRNPALALAARWIAKELGKRAAKCGVEAAEACRSNWGHFRALVNCAKEFAKNNKGKCLA